MDDISMASAQDTTPDYTSDSPVPPNTGTQLDVKVVANDSGYQVSHSSVHPKVGPGCTHQAYKLSRARPGVPS
jgi:hypothetical protein